VARPSPRSGVTIRAEGAYARQDGRLDRTGELAATRGDFLDHARHGRLPSAHRSDLHRL